MKKIVLTLLLASLLAVPLVAAPPQGPFAKPATPSDVASIDNTTFIDANNILMFVTNHGNFCRDLTDYFGYDAGTFFPYSSEAAIVDGSQTNYCLYASGLWVGGRVDGERRVIIAEYSDEYVPGPMVGGTFVVDNPAFKVYKLYSDSLAGNPNDDYTNWPVDQGAPVDELGNPAMVGDQMLWAVYNDANSAQHSNNSGSTDPLGLEVQQTTFAWDQQGALGNIIFIRLQVYNKGGNDIDSCYMALWSDPDLGDAGDDLVGCDSLLGIGYVYNSTNNDTQYGDAPPAVGYDFFQGPLEYTGDDADTALMWDTTFVGYRNLGMSSFNKYINGTDPDNATQTYNYMRGLNRDGTVYTYDGNPTRFFVSGDPVAGTGDLDGSAADRRFMMSTGPFTFAAGDSTEILAAIVVGQGADRLNSIEVMRELDIFAQGVYENGFNPPSPPAKPQVTVAQVQSEIVITWTDSSEVDPGDFPFEGYSVWQCENEAGQNCVLLATYDSINGRDISLIDTLKNSVSGEYLPTVIRKLTESGLRRHYTTGTDILRGAPIRNLTTYFFKVTAFNFGYITPAGDAAPRGDRFKESATVVRITPKPPIAGLTSTIDAHDTLPVAHVGASDGIVSPLVMDPFAMTGESYKVDFGKNLDDETYWYLYNTTTGDTLVEESYNISGDDNYLTFDGLMIKVQGPALEGNSYHYSSSDPVNISPVTLTEYPEYVQDRVDYTGRWFTGTGDGELLFGGVYLAYNFQGSTVEAPDYKPVDIVWRPMESYTDLNGNGTFTTGEPYVAGEAPDTSYAFMYSGWGNGLYEGFFEMPFSAYDVSDPDNPRRLIIVVRDRDQNHQWDWSEVLEGDDALNMPNGGDFQYNYVWIMDLDYDATGTYYGDGTGGTIGFMGDPVDYGSGQPALWNLWLESRGVGGFLAEEGTLELIPNYVITPADTFTFSSTLPTQASGESNLDGINVVPNPFYLYGPYDPGLGNYKIQFQGLPETCTIKIFNLGGDLVRTIDKDDPSTSLATWDARTENNLPVASGIYIYVVEAPGFGTKIGKMAVFTEVEVLTFY